MPLKLLGIQVALVQTLQKPCSKGFAEVNMQFRCSTAYPLYLAHMPVFLLLYGFRVSESGWVFILVAIVFSIVLDRCFDRPLKRLISRQLKLNVR